MPNRTKVLYHDTCRYLDEEESPLSNTCEVMEEDDDPEPTGILDAEGNMLYRQRVKQPIGFRLG